MIKSKQVLFCCKICKSGGSLAGLLEGNYYLRHMGEYSLGDAIKDFLSKSRLKSYVQAIQIEEVWEQIMGKTIAKYTEKIVINGDKLFITTYVAPLKQELLYQKDTIIQRVNEALGEKVVKEVVIA